MIKTIAVLGGDKRMLYAAEGLSASGYTVNIVCFDEGNVDITASILNSDAVIFPIPPIKNDVYLNTPLIPQKIRLTDDIADAIEKRTVFCAMQNKLANLVGKWSLLNYIDYYDNEELVLKNAVLTAKATLKILEEKGKNTDRLKALIMGWGRVGKACASVLSHQYDICVTARKNSDFDDILKNGYQFDCTSNPHNISDYDIIINTIPALVLNSDLLLLINKDSLVIDLASGVGGTDFKAADENGITAIHALGLPGKYFPQESGYIIKDTLLSIIEGDAL